MKNYVLLALVLCTLSGFSQNEIDKLVEKYGGERIVLYTTSGELKGESGIKKNSEGKPYSISIEGEAEDREQIAELFLGLFQQKLKEGYKLTRDNILLEHNMNKENIANAILSNPEFGLSGGGVNVEFKKGNYTFKAIANAEHKNILRESPIGLGVLERKLILKFQIEMIDSKRLGGEKAKTFKF